MRLTFRPGESADARADDVSLRRNGRRCACDGGSEIRHDARTSAARAEDFRLVPGYRAVAVVGPVSRSVVKPSVQLLPGQSEHLYESSRSAYGCACGKPREPGQPIHRNRNPGVNG